MGSLPVVCSEEKHWQFFFAGCEVLGFDVEAPICNVCTPDKENEVQARTLAL